MRPHPVRNFRSSTALMAKSDSPPEAARRQTDTYCVCTALGLCGPSGAVGEHDQLSQCARAVCNGACCLPPDAEARRQRFAGCGRQRAIGANTMKTTYRPIGQGSDQGWQERSVSFSGMWTAPCRGRQRDMRCAAACNCSSGLNRCPGTNGAAAPIALRRGTISGHARLPQAAAEWLLRHAACRDGKPTLLRLDLRLIWKPRRTLLRPSDRPGLHAG